LPWLEILVLFQAKTSQSGKDFQPRQEEPTGYEQQSYQDGIADEIADEKGGCEYCQGPDFLEQQMLKTSQGDAQEKGADD